jgi:hypothetical protein
VGLILNKYKRDLELFRLKRLFYLLCVPFFLNAETTTDPIRVSARHIESKGIGYSQGYTTLEAFYASTEACGGTWIPFLDVRGHIFNNGRAAINSGVGIRYIAQRVWGIYGYYDYRNKFHHHYNQAALGFESLGRTVDFRLNINHPFGNKEFALQALSGEVGVKVYPFYFAAGPYYLNGRGGTAWGGKIRANLEMYRHFRLELSSSYDPLFGWIGQGELSVRYLFGGKKEGKTYSKQAFQHIDRMEIISVFRK